MHDVDSRRFLRDLAERHERDGFAHERSAGHGLTYRVERKPRAANTVPIRAEVDAMPRYWLGSKYRLEPLVLLRECRSGLRRMRELVLERHRGENRLAVMAVSARTLFAPLGPTYDRYSALLSFGQDPRWRRFLVSRLDVGSSDTVLDVATGTGLVARELVRRFGCAVVGLDQSPEMLAVAAERTRGLPVRLVEGRAETLPFTDGEFAALTFTYLLRYVEDPAATMRELARVVRPGGTIAMLEFALPHGVWRPPWELWVRAGLPTAGRLISPGWHEVGRFLGPSIREFWRRHDAVELFRGAGIEDVRARRLSLGGGIVVWGRRG